MRSDNPFNTLIKCLSHEQGKPIAANPNETLVCSKQVGNALIIKMCFLAQYSVGCTLFNLRQIFTQDSEYEVEICFCTVVSVGISVAT